jgi:hypothetical protein
VAVGGCVGVFVGVLVAVAVAAAVGVPVGVFVGDGVGDFVGEAVGAIVGVFVGVEGPAQGQGRDSQAIPSLSPSRLSGSPGCEFRWAWAAAWLGKSEQSLSVLWEAEAPPAAAARSPSKQTSGTIMRAEERMAEVLSLGSVC